ncbi:MAG: sulfotransferase [Ahniella sp.]|nr:sulfotransferase [Ahniella sp.]
MNVETAPTGSLNQAIAHARQLLHRQPALAEAQAREILKAVPDQADAQLLLASALRLSGKAESARTVIDPLRQRYPRSAAVWLEWGRIAGRLGKGDIAGRALQRAVDLEPALPGAWLALADHFQAAGDDSAAEQALARHLRHSARDPELMAAADALVANRIPQAERALRERLFKTPTDIAAIRMMAEVAARLGRHEDAEHLLARCLVLVPDFHSARQQFAMMLHRNNKPEAALVQLDTLLRVDPENASARNLKAAVLCRTGDYQTALALYAGLIEQFPDQAKLALSHGHALKTAGRQQDSITAYRHAISIDPGFGEAWWSLANLKTFRFDADDIALMRKQLERTDLAKDQLAQFEFALGKALEDESKFEESFQHYAHGNALRREMVPYQADDASARVRRSKQVFTKAFFESRLGVGDPSPDPIFILGLPRSGSTLIEQILSSHSQVEGTMELPEIISITRSLRERAAAAGLDSYHALLATLPADELAALGALYLDRTRIQRKQGRPLFIDKMPNNFRHIGLIHAILPNAKIIDARRSAMGCCFSGFKQYFARGQNFSYGLEDLGRYYADYVALMAHFDEVLPGRVHRVVYEQMVENTEAEVHALLDYCGLPFEAGCLRFFENDRPVRTASSEQVRKPIYRDGVDHWRHYEPWLEPLKLALGPVLEHYPGVPPCTRKEHDPDTPTTYPGETGDEES